MLASLKYQQKIFYGDCKWIWRSAVQFPLRISVTLAQLVERLTFNQVVMGSIPICDTNILMTDGQRMAFLHVVVGSIPAQDA